MSKEEIKNCFYELLKGYILCIYLYVEIFLYVGID